MEDTLKDFPIPDWMKDCPLTFDWCVYNGQVYFASINYEESERRNKPVLDLAYCATKAMNGIFLIKRVWNKKRFQLWKSGNEHTWRVVTK